MGNDKLTNEEMAHVIYNLAERFEGDSLEVATVLYTVAGVVITGTEISFIKCMKPFGDMLAKLTSEAVANKGVVNGR